MRLLHHLQVVKDGSGKVTELRCTYDPATRGGDAPDGRKVQGTIHWVAASTALECEVRLYDRLFSVPEPDAVDDFTAVLNPGSLLVVKGAKIEPGVAGDPAGSRYQFERTGYFMSDPIDSREGALVYNRTVGLRDSWAKVKAK
jgi:glutaminyl-tRNA synthetase